MLLDGVVGAVTDTTGSVRIRGVRPGWHRVAARLIGYRGVVLDSVFVRAGATVTADLALESSPVELAPLEVTAPVDELLDPLATASEQKISASDLRDLPVSSLEEAVALSAGSVGTSYRGGRVGEESFILDGLGIKNQLDAASGGLGLQLPPDFLGEASLVTNVLGPLRSGTLRPGQCGHPRSGGGLARSARVRDRSSLRRLARSRARPLCGKRRRPGRTTGRPSRRGGRERQGRPRPGNAPRPTIPWIRANRVPIPCRTTAGSGGTARQSW